MKRDHLLGFPPVLLALDPESRPRLATPVPPRLSEKEQGARRELDKALTAKLTAPTQKIAFAYFERDQARKRGLFQWYRLPPEAVSDLGAVPEYFNHSSKTWVRSAYAMEHFANHAYKLYALNALPPDLPS